MFAFAPMSVTHATVYVVTLDGMSFTPATITIYEGDAIPEAPECARARIRAHNGHLASGSRNG